MFFYPCRKSVIVIGRSNPTIFRSGPDTTVTIHPHNPTSSIYFFCDNNIPAQTRNLRERNKDRKIISFTPCSRLSTNCVTIRAHNLTLSDFIFKSLSPLIPRRSNVEYLLTRYVIKCQDFGWSGHLTVHTPRSSFDAIKPMTPLHVSTSGNRFPNFIF